MLLYHGTSLNVAERALIKGISPCVHAKGNWEVCPSHPELVYLSECYAPYFALDTNDKSNSIAILEVDVSFLEEENMRPDEDFLEQVSCNPILANKINLPKNIKSKNIFERTKWFRDQHNKFAHLWLASLKSLGNCAHYRTIPSEAITRAVSFDIKSNVYLMCGIDPVISILNYRTMSEYYCEITKWFFEADVNLEVLETFGMHRSVLENRSGLKQLR